MKVYTPEEIEARKTILPDDLKQALQSVDMMRELQTIVAEQHLHVDEAGMVADIIELTLSGILRVREFTYTLQEILPEMKREKILSLTEQVNKRIFAKVQESLRKIDQTQVETIKETLVISETPLASSLPSISNSIPETAGIKSMEPIHMEKLSKPVATPTTARDISHESLDPRVKLIPLEIKQKINNDPYKEPIE